MYCVSGYILVDTMEDSGNGANFAIEDVPTYSDCVYDTQGEWKYVEWYGETEADQNEVQLDVRVGGYGAESQGTAYFDDISVRQVDSLPDGVTASLWYNVDTGFVNDDTSDAEETTPEKSTLLFGLLAAAFLLLVAIGARYALRQDTLSKPQPVRTYLVFFLAMVAALILRIILGGNVAGYQVDMNCFSAWSLRMAQTGPSGFYSPDYFCDYPPGYMLLLWPVGLLIRAIGYSNSPTVRLIIKAIPILCDMAAAMVLFVYAKKRVSLKAAVLVSLMRCKTRKPYP